jgi:hypothetical protein
VLSCSTLSWIVVILSNSIEKAYMSNYKNVQGSHQTCKQPILNTELYKILNYIKWKLVILMN